MRRLFRRLFVVALLSAAASAAQAQNIIDDSNFNYAYSVFVGTGVYRAEDQTIFILRVPAAWTLREPDFDTGQIGWRFLLPFSVGVANFDELEDIPELRFDDLKTLTATPGVEVQIPFSSNWLLKPFGQAGAGTDLDSDDYSVVLGAGTRVRGVFGEGERWIVGGEFLWARNRPSRDLETTSFTRWGIGFEYKQPTNWQLFDRRLSFHGRILHYYFANPVNFDENNRRFEIDRSTEIGISFGIDRPINILGYKFRQGGIGYERSGEYNAIKFFTRFPF